jgi:GT2 family glycosyltransferase
MTHVTIGFTPRERFSQAAESLQTILENTRVSFDLVIVNCNIPDRYWREMELLIRGRDNVKVLETDTLLLPNQSKNLVLREARGDWICLIENDNLVPPGWLEMLVAACEEFPADVAVPLLMEGRPGQARVHFDDGLGFVEEVETPDGVQRRVRHRRISKEEGPGSSRRPEEFMETHCLLFRREVFDRIGPFDEEINTSEEVDLSLALYDAKVPVVFEPACTIHYILPTFPLDPEDQEYFLKKWDVEGARRSHERITRQRRLAVFPQTIGFVMERHMKGKGGMVCWRDELLEAIPATADFVLADLGEWSGAGILDGLGARPFTERDGVYWGPPADDAGAIAELERQREAGARYFAVPWHAFWLLEFYPDFVGHLHEHYKQTLDADHLVVFELRGAGR